MAYHFALVRVVEGVWQKNGTLNETTKSVVSCPNRITQLQSNHNSNKTCTKAPKQPPTKLCEYCKLRNIYLVLSWSHTLAKFIQKKIQKKRNRSQGGPNKNRCIVCTTYRTTKPNQNCTTFYTKLFDRSYTMCLMTKLVWIK